MASTSSRPGPSPLPSTVSPNHRQSGSGAGSARRSRRQFVKIAPRASSRIEQADSGQQNPNEVPFLTSDASARGSIDRLLADAVDAEVDDVADAAGLDLDPPALAVEHERHRDDGLERVPLRSPGRRDVGFAARHPDGEVEDALDGLGRKPGAVVGDGDAGSRRP